MIELFLPAQCLLCGLPSNNKLICSYCEKNILADRIYCAHCALTLNQESDYCGDCLQKTYFFDHIHALGDYNPSLSRLIKQLKYQQQLIAGELLGELLLKSVKARYTHAQLEKFDALLAVPLHPKKLQLRGFNQAQIIASCLHKGLNIPLLENKIQRCRHTTAQEGLSVAKRKANLKNAFRCVDPSALNAKNIIVVDDVVTTGATINSLCELLQQQGVNSITVFCISRTSLSNCKH